jgi:hypothetical protein
MRRIRVVAKVRKPRDRDATVTRLDPRDPAIVRVKERMYATRRSSRRAA